MIGNVGVGLQAPTVKLHVNGGVLATKVYLYKPNAANDTGAVYLEYDSTKLGIHLVVAGIYTDTYVSALGVGSGGSGSSGTLHDLDDVDIDDNTLHSGQILVYRNTHWVNENMPSIGGGTVTSVSMSVPTGFAISGSPITGSGTLALTFASGYSLPTTAKQTNWDSAYTFTNGFSSTTINTALGFTLSGTAGETYDLDDFLTGINASMINTALGFTISGTSGETYNLDDIGTLASYFTNGIADYAACLTTVNKQAWGQTYWTANGVPESISGDINDADNIYMSNNKRFYIKNANGQSKSCLTIDTSNNLVIGEGMADASNHHTYLRGWDLTFQVYSGGNTTALTISSAGLVEIVQNDQGIKIGDAYIVWDSVNQALKVTGANGAAMDFYATGGVSALGYSS